MDYYNIDKSTLSKNVGKLMEALVISNCEDYFLCKRASLLGLKTYGRYYNVNDTLESSANWFFSKQYRDYVKNNPKLVGNAIIYKLDKMAEDTDTYNIDYFRREYNQIFYDINNDIV